MAQAELHEPPTERLTPELVLVCPELRELAYERALAHDGTIDEDALDEAELGEAGEDEAERPDTRDGPGTPLRVRSAGASFDAPSNGDEARPDRSLDAEAAPIPEGEAGRVRSLRARLPGAPVLVATAFLALASATVLLAEDADLSGPGPLSAPPPANERLQLVPLKKELYVRPTPTAPEEAELPKRAFVLASWLANKPRPTKPVLRRWRLEHAAIVRGARAGALGGVEALRILITVDQNVQARWQLGARRTTIARRALREVAQSG